MLPLVKPLAKFVEKIIPEREEDEARDKKRKTRFIDPRLLKMPVIAAQLAKEEVQRVGWITHKMLEKAYAGILKQDMDAVKWVLKKEADVDSISWNLENFLDSIPSDKLNPDEQETLENLKHHITDIERVGDHANNLAEFARKLDKKKIKITKYGRKELRTLFRRVLSNYGAALKAVASGNKKYVNHVIKREDEIDALEKKFKRNHIERLKQRICNPEAGTIFVESLRNLERISDHAYNIVLSLIN